MYCGCYSVGCRICGTGSRSVLLLAWLVMFYPRAVHFSVLASGGLFLNPVRIWVLAQEGMFCSKMIKLFFHFLVLFRFPFYFQTFSLTQVCLYVTELLVPTFPGGDQRPEMDGSVLQGGGRTVVPGPAGCVSAHTEGLSL